MRRAEAAVRNADAVEAMGMRANVLARWGERHEEATELQASALRRSGIVGSVSKFVRLVLQIATLAGIIRE